MRLDVRRRSRSAFPPTTPTYERTMNDRARARGIAARKLLDNALVASAEMEDKLREFDREGYAEYLTEGADFAELLVQARKVGAMVNEHRLKLREPTYE